MPSGRDRSTTLQSSTVPKDFANVAPPQSVMLDHSFTLQAVMELQKSVSELATKTDRLIKDVEAQGAKIDVVRQQISFVKGAMWVIGTLVALASIVAAYLRFMPH
jgi:predicted amino acid-binding ACT domain protein